ncbi:hypothetical protein ACFPM0_09870 [Pseudonocardia sulfidoxydans]|uniref:hypothetical protein n=1 Tax=Pseudonocardia sulfidoxydans TaxID=54011 RepID=UPI003618DDBE
MTCRTDTQDCYAGRQVGHTIGYRFRRGGTGTRCVVQSGSATGTPDEDPGGRRSVR